MIKINPPAKILPFVVFLFGIWYLQTANSTENRFPPPSFKAIQEESKKVYELGKAEVLSMSFSDLSRFLLDRYYYGPGEDFEYLGSNPKQISPEDSKLPATILVHAYNSNQGQWIPLIESIHKHKKEEKNIGPIFTFNFKQETDLIQLINKVEKIRDLYQEAGQSHVNINLVGHSLGAINSAEYAFNPDLWVENTTVNKVISIAGRLKNIDPPIDTPYYAYSYDVLQRVDKIWNQISENRGIVELYAIAASDDWLIPKRSVLVEEDENNQTVIPSTGHVLVSRSPMTAAHVLFWLIEKQL